MRITISFAASIVFALVVFTSEFANAETRVIATWQSSYLEEVDGLPVLHLKGTSSEMGTQYGVLAGDRVKFAIDLISKIARDNAKFIPKWVIPPLRRMIGWVFWQTFPRDTKKEIEGMVAGAKMRTPKVKFSKYDVAFMNSIVDIVGIFRPNKDGLPGAATLRLDNEELLKTLGVDWIRANCDSMAVWGPRTKEGKTFQTRNVDIDTGMGLESIPLVIVYKPAGGVPYVTATFASYVGMFTGMNAFGVGMGQVWGFSKLKGIATPWPIQMKKVMANARSAHEAVEIFRHAGKKTYGSNFVFADPLGEGFAVEMNHKQFSVFTANDPREDEAKWNGEIYSIRMPNAVFRGDVAMDPALRANQTAARGPGGDPRIAGSYINRYKGQADRILAFEKEGVLIGKEEAESISRATAMRGGNLQDAVYANSDRELWVSYAKPLEDGSIRQAYDGEYIHIPFAKYLATLEKDENGRLKVNDWDVKHEGLRIEVRGKTAELIDSADGTLVDRLAL